MQMDRQVANLSRDDRDRLSLFMLMAISVWRTRSKTSARMIGQRNQYDPFWWHCRGYWQWVLVLRATGWMPFSAEEDARWVWGQPTESFAAVIADWPAKRSGLNLDELEKLRVAATAELERMIAQRMVHLPSAAMERDGMTKKNLN